MTMTSLRKGTISGLLRHKTYNCLKVTGAAVQPLRQFNSSRISREQNGASDLDLSKLKDKSPQEVLEIGFRRMQEIPNYKKSEAELKPILDAARQLGIDSSKIAHIYHQTEVKGAGRLINRKVPRNPDDHDYEQNRLDVNKYEVRSREFEHRPFRFDDISSLGHLQLRDHRVQREYNRVAAYYLPLLSKYASEYKPPVEKQVVKFRYTTYMGEPHAGEKRVVATFKTSSLGLKPEELHKLRLLAGVRYNPVNDEIKLTAELFPEAAQNVRYIGTLLKSLIANAKDSKDTFSDIPIDSRHIEARQRRRKARYPTHKFPESWKRPEDAPKHVKDYMSVLTDTYVKLPKM